MTWLPIVIPSARPAPPSVLEAQTPVSIAPTIPPTACTPKTSSESSYLSRRLSLVALRTHRKPAVAPIKRAPTGPAVPEAGVIATRPAIAPEAIPSTLGLPWNSHSVNIQERAAVAVAIWVTAMAIPAVPLAPTALPALKPNQPIQSMDAPTTVSAKLWGGIGVWG